MASANGRPAAFARHESAGRLEAVRVAVRFAPDPAARGEDGAVDQLEVAEAPLRPGGHRIGPFAVHLAADVEGPAARLQAVVRNGADEPVHLESLVLGFRWSGAPPGGLRFLRHGWQSWSFTASQDLDPAGEPVFPSGPWLRGMHHGVGAPPPDRSGWHESHLVSVVGAGQGGACCLAGVLETGESTGLVYLRRVADGVEVEVELRLEVPLAPGEERGLEPVRVALGEDASALLEAHAEEHGR